ncbi:MAG: NAD-glutamate dehydrogenase [Rickettsia sp.]|nr:NAD-glutamate dehydrogenase [Rickettsia sp.]
MSNKNYLSQFKVVNLDLEKTIFLNPKYENNKLYQKFVTRVIQYIPIDYQTDINFQTFSKIFEPLYEFAKKKDGYEKIEDFFSAGENLLDIFILCEYTPFLVDSLHNLMARFNLNNSLFLHPVIYSIRDSKLHLKDVCLENNENDLNKSTINKEHLIFLRFEGSFSQKEITSLKSEIHNIIHLSKTTLSLWNILSNSVQKILDLNYFDNFTNNVLKWILNNNFTFLASIKFTYSSELSIDEQIIVKGMVEDENLTELKDIIIKSFQHNAIKETLFGKINILSKIHRNSFLDYILIRDLKTKDIKKSGYLILGLYTGSMYFHSISEIPMLNHYNSLVNDDLNFAPSGYNAKKVNHIIESIPRDALMNLATENLKHIALHLLSSIRNKKLKIFIYEDWANIFTNIIIFLRKSYLTSENFNNIIKYLENIFGVTIQVNNMDVIFDNFILLYILFPTSKIKLQKNIDLSQIEEDLTRLSVSWHENLSTAISSNFDIDVIFDKDFNLIFEEDYKYKFTPEEAIKDLKFLYDLSQVNKTIFNCIHVKERKYILKIYTRDFFSLSELMPLISNIGFEVKSEQHFVINNVFSKETNYIFLFEILSLNITNYGDLLKYNIDQNLTKMLDLSLPTNILAKLTTYCNIGWKEIFLLNALVAFFAQTKIPYSKDFVRQILLNHNEFTTYLVKFFELKFKNNSSQEIFDKTEKFLVSYLEKIISIDEDLVLNSIYQIINAILRTNFYQKKIQEKMEYISFKFDSSKIPNLQKPVPYKECFVFSNLFEGSHLRAGAISRGGIRWSDREEDFRVEVLGLMRSQITKNTVIVPTGAKGVFYLKTQDQEKRNELAIESYKNFLRGLLDITDNIIDSNFVHPKECKIYDKNDSYLVVAADKGTSSFSDYANEVAKEYNFWLDDAFASGGSLGYDHKKMAITAQGAWVSVKHHLKNMNFDYKNTNLRVVGIGDMSGDVFGNGMLLHKNIQLIAAFNHKEIFIDPQPNVEKSFSERKRLFFLKKTSWKDYNNSCISSGGGVFNRSSKSLSISPEIQDLLKINISKITPDKLIRLILTLDVDLIWNGGIGTYFKSSSESNQDIGDKENDHLRCNANQIRAKVIAEGGNLGISQLGRIEFASIGGFINTDFIDNSAGVSCSDHEVNLKIILNQAVQNNLITFGERNQILIDMSSELEKIVLQDNYDQNLALDILQSSNLMRTELFEQLLRLLEQKNILDRSFEFLPDDKKLTKLNSLKQKLTRPELAVILSYSKLYFLQNLSNNLLIDDTIFEKHLVKYFPYIMRTQFKKFILKHPLKNQIIITNLVNEIVNRVTGPLIIDIYKKTGAKLCDTIKSYIIISEIMDLDNLWNKIVQKCHSLQNSQLKIEILSNVINIIVRGIIWFLKNTEYPIAVNHVIKIYKNANQMNFEKFLVGKSKEQFLNDVQFFSKSCIDENLAKRISSLRFIISFFDIISLCETGLENQDELLNLYFFIGENFYIDWLREVCSTQIDNSYWNKLSIQSIKDDLYMKQKNILSILMKKWKFSGSSIDTAKDHLKDKIYNSIFHEFIMKMKTYEEYNISMLILANKKLDSLIENLVQ